MTIPTLNQSVVQAIDGYKPVPSILSNIATDINSQVKALNLLPYWKIWVSNNLMHSVEIRASLDPQETWPHSIFHNSRGLMIAITGSCGKRWIVGDNDIVFTKLDIDFHYQHNLPSKLRNKKNVPSDQVASYIVKQLLKLKQ